MSRKHGKSGSRVYRIWRGMLERCSNPNIPHYSSYGGRGIKACKRWHSFEKFYLDMGDPPPGTSLDRINVNRGYNPSNCKWATAEEQANNRRDNVTFEIEGETLTLSQIAERFGINRSSLNGRLKHGWSLEKAISTPVAKKVRIPRDERMRRLRELAGRVFGAMNDGSQTGAE